MPRLFTAIEVPDDVRADLARLKQPMPGAKWVDANDLHLTVRFAGDIGAGAAREFQAELNAADADAFEISLNGLGAFGGDDPKTIYAAVAPCPALDALARAHERAARNAGLPPERRTFKPHVTLARLRNGSVEKVANYLSKHGTFKTAAFFVSRAVLFSSKPLVGGGPYVIEATYALRGGYDGGIDGDWEDEE